jgi:hypothetical protein
MSPSDSAGDIEGPRTTARRHGHPTGLDVTDDHRADARRIAQ